MPLPAIVVFSHLRWNHVFQRPHHLFSRFAARRRVLFVEEPVEDMNHKPHWEYEEPAPNLTVCRPHTQIVGSVLHDQQVPQMSELLMGLLAAERLHDHDYIAWLYTPMAVPLLPSLHPRKIVYDCMDDLASFRFAPRELAKREATLMKLADVLFAGGRSMYEARRGSHSNVHCFPSSVEASHFAQARPGQGLAEAEDQRELPHPRLGYLGVLDERIDWELIRDMAQRRPHWQLVLVGPTAKVDDVQLPRENNIVYIGRRSYDELPGYLAGWDVCLMPFARNDATRFISPTKTLEYMAAERPIVSTPITDVARPYGEIVYIAEKTAEFIAACECAMSARRGEYDARVAKMRAVLANTSWDKTVQAMTELVDEVRPTRKPSEVSTATRGFASRARSVPIVVAGAGPTGLSAAYHAGADAVLIEQNEQVGGLCRSVEKDGFIFDCAGHIMFSSEPYVHQMYEMLLGDNVHWQDREAWIYSKGVYTRYPFQGSLYGLPADVIKECVVGAIEARFGSVKSTAVPRSGSGAREPYDQLTNAANGSGKECSSLDDCCADGVLESTAKLGPRSAITVEKQGPANFEEFIYQIWGRGIAKHFAIPYNRKLWTVDLKEMETSWLGGRVPVPDLEEMIEGALKPSPKPMGPNARFGYPLRGGFQALMNGFLPRLRGPLLTGRKVVSVSARRHTVTLSDGQTIAYDKLVSTMPLPYLVRMLGDEAPLAIQQAARMLRHVSVRCVHLGVGREKLTEKHWIYYPEDTIFHRSFVQGNASPHCNRPGGFGLTFEITYSSRKPLPCDGDALTQRVIDDCVRVGLIDRTTPIWTSLHMDLPYAYVVYDHNRAESIRLVREWAEGQDIVLSGRYSEWEYYNSDHAFLAGKKAIERCRQPRPAPLSV